VVAEIQRSFQFYLASAGEETIERLYLSGGSSRLKGLREVLASRLKLPVELLNPFRRIAISEKLFDVDYVYDLGPMAAVAVGLALRQRGGR
jgi:type IV pilus assembly protein PilM